MLSLEKQLQTKGQAAFGFLSGMSDAEQNLRVALLTGGFDRPYVYGLSRELAATGIAVEVIGSNEIDGPEMRQTPNLRFFNLYGDRQPNVPTRQKVSRVLSYYRKLIWYAARSKAGIFHILWNNKFAYFDRTILTLYYKLLGKKIVFTAHNVNAGKRDGNDSFMNRLTLKTQYRLTDHILVHTERMKQELIEDFGVSANKATVIPFGINNSVPDTSMTSGEARQLLEIGNDERVVLFYGAIRPYKGLEYLIGAIQQVNRGNRPCRLVIAGEPRADGTLYFQELQRKIASDPALASTIQRIEFVPDAETEIYFKAADVSALPYTEVFQSGVLFLSYSFGLPVITSDVGSFSEDVIEGETGYVSKTRDSSDLANKLRSYFESELYRSLPSRRQSIRAYANRKHSWQTVGVLTRAVYSGLAGPMRQVRGDSPTRVDE